MDGLHHTVTQWVCIGRHRRTPPPQPNPTHPFPSPTPTLPLYTQKHSTTTHPKGPLTLTQHQICRANVDVQLLLGQLVVGGSSPFEHQARKQVLSKEPVGQQCESVMCPTWEQNLCH